MAKLGELLAMTACNVIRNTHIEYLKAMAKDQSENLSCKRCRNGAAVLRHHPNYWVHNDGSICSSSWYHELERMKRKRPSQQNGETAGAQHK